MTRVKQVREPYLRLTRLKNCPPGPMSHLRPVWQPWIAQGSCTQSRLVNSPGLPARRRRRATSSQFKATQSLHDHLGDVSSRHLVGRLACEGQTQTRDRSGRRQGSRVPWQAGDAQPPPAAPPPTCQKLGPHLPVLPILAVEHLERPRTMILESCLFVEYACWVRSDPARAGAPVTGAPAGMAEPGPLAGQGPGRRSTGIPALPAPRCQLLRAESGSSGSRLF